MQMDAKFSVGWYRRHPDTGDVKFSRLYHADRLCCEDAAAGLAYAPGMISIEIVNLNTGERTAVLEKPIFEIFGSAVT